MTKEPYLTGPALVIALQRAGFKVARMRSGHTLARNADGRRSVVPAHLGEAISRGLLVKIADDCEISQGDLLKLL